MRRVRAATVAVEKQNYIFWIFVCSLRYPACRAQFITHYEEEFRL